MLFFRWHTHELHISLCAYDLDHVVIVPSTLFDREDHSRAIDAADPFAIVLAGEVNMSVQREIYFDLLKKLYELPFAVKL